MEVPPNHPFIDGFSIINYKPSSVFAGLFPRLWETPQSWSTFFRCSNAQEIWVGLCSWTMSRHPASNLGVFEGCLVKSNVASCGKWRFSIVMVAWWYPNSWMVFLVENPTKILMIWGYLHFRNLVSAVNELWMGKSSIKHGQLRNSPQFRLGKCESSMKGGFASFDCQKVSILIARHSIDP